MIPKTIHYCWFGRNPKPELVERCIASWKQYCPDYEIIEWNEDNYDVNSIPYTAEAYAARKWAFVSDYARLKVVYDHGGIYLDTDVLLHHSLDELLLHDCWLAQEDVRFVSTGLGFGAIAHYPLIKSMMSSYESSTAEMSLNSVMDTATLERVLPNWIKSDRSQTIDGLHIIGLRDYGKFAKHLATLSWTSEESQQARKQILDDMFHPSKKAKCRQYIRHKIYRFKRICRHPALIAYFDKRKGTKLEKIYTFCAYDLLDYGPVHFAKRLIRKILRMK